MVDIKWFQTQEGQKAYQTWIRKLANRAEDRTDIPILVDTNGEIQVWVTINKKYLSKEQFEKLADKSDGEVTTKLEFKTKDIIIRELTSIAKSRDTLADNEDERELLCPLVSLFQGIEDAITNDICYKAQNAKQLFINNFEKNLGKDENNSNNLLTN